jgi:membrane-associated phospholipid phosphatase
VLFAGVPAAGAAVLEGDSLRPAATGSPNIGDTIWTDIQESWTDAVLLFSAPAHFSLRGWGTVGWVAAGTGMSMLVDDNVRLFFLKRHGTTGDAIGDFGTTYGSPYPALGITAVLYGAGLAFDEPGIRRAGRHIAQSVLYAAAITTTLKTLIGRHRPFLDDGPYSYHGPTFKDEFNSLPSGHSTLAFALSSSLAADIDNPWATAGLYGLAALTGLTRIYNDRHWLSDVFLGAAIGTACGYGVHHLHDAEPGALGLKIMPMYNGVMVSYLF